MRAALSDCCSYFVLGDVVLGLLVLPEGEPRQKFDAEFPTSGLWGIEEYLRAEHPLLSQREKLNLRLQSILDQHTAPWGVKVSMVEVKQVDLAEQMIRAIARQAEAERERRAKVIHAEGELQASEKLLQAAEMLAKKSEAMQLRYLQTLTQIAGDKASTIVFPVPMDVLGPLLKKP